MKYAKFLAAGTVVWATAGVCVGQPTPINGTLKPQYGPVQWVQQNPTGFGDNFPGGNTCTPFADGIVVGLNNMNTGGVIGTPPLLADAPTVAAAAAVTTGFEFKIPLSVLGNPSGSIRIAAFVNGGGFDFLSNQLIGGTAGGGAVALGNLGEPRAVDFTTVPGNQYVTVGPATPDSAEPAIDGVLDATFYGAALFVQDTNTQFGNASTVGQLNANGSEIDNVYARIATVGGNTSLFLFIGGNFESNFNKLCIFIDTGAAGQNQLRGDNPNVAFNGLNRMGANTDTGNPPVGPGLKFDAGFNASYFLDLNIGGTPVTYYADFAELLATGGGRGRYLGSATANPLTASPSCPPPPTLPDPDIAVGSEIDNLYATVCGNTLYVFVGGNLEVNGNKLDLFFDVRGGGQNQLRNNNVQIDNGGLNRMGTDAANPTTAPGLKFDTGFDADYWLSFRNSGTPVEVFAYAGFLRTNGAANDGFSPPALFDFGSFQGGPKSANTPIAFDGTYCVRRDVNNACAPNGSGTMWNPGPTPLVGIDVQGDSNATANSLPVVTEIWSSYAPRLISAAPFDPLGFNAGDTDLHMPGLINIAINNSNIAGVNATSGAGAAQVTTGIEFSIRLDELGWDNVSPIKITGFINGAGHDVVSNQIIGGTQSAIGNLNEPRTVDFNAVAGGPHYVVVTPGTCAGAIVGACCVGTNTCIIMSQAQCTTAAVGGTFQGNASVCNPNPCGGPVTGACCRGSTCAVTTAAACPNQTNQKFRGVGTICNAGGNRTTPCCEANYNQDSVRDVNDIFAYLSGWFSNNPFADIGGLGNSQVNNIFIFLSAWFAGCATP